jgi:hypothetical protein
MIHIHYVFYENELDPDEMPLVYRMGVESTIGQVITEGVFKQLGRCDYMPMIANIVYLH